MSTYRAFEVTGARKFELVEREVQEPPLGHVRLRVEACGVCHTDVVAVEGMRPVPSSPVVPGHEVVGVIDAVGPGVTTWRIGGRGIPGRPVRSVRLLPAWRLRQLRGPATDRQ